MTERFESEIDYYPSKEWFEERTGDFKERWEALSNVWTSESGRSRRGGKDLPGKPHWTPWTPQEWRISRPCTGSL